MALSDREGSAKLVFPEGETWLGRVTDCGDRNLVRVIVPTALLSGFIADFRHAIIKLDVEGHEASVLAGAPDTLFTQSRLILFEANSAADLNKMSNLFSEWGLIIFALKNGKSLPLNSASASSNFCAVRPDTPAADWLMSRV